MIHPALSLLIAGAVYLFISLRGADSRTHAQVVMAVAVLIVAQYGLMSVTVLIHRT